MMVFFIFFASDFNEEIFAVYEWNSYTI